MNEMKQYKAALFDLDGTLLDTSEGILCAVDAAIRSCGLHDLTPEEKRSVIGPPIDRSMKRLYGLSDEKAAEAAAVFRKYYAEEYLMRAAAYPGIYDTLRALRAGGWKIGIATYKRNDYAQRLLAETGFLALSDFALGQENPAQTKADIIDRCMEALGVTPAQTVMVGDTVHDLTGAADAGAAFLGVTYGFGFQTAEEIMEQGAMAAAASPAEVLHILL